MKLGVVFPQTEIGADRGGVRAYAEAVQELGFEHLHIFDHVVGADTTDRPGWSGYTMDSMFHEPFVVLGFIAAVAPGLELVPAVIILPQRQTVRAAKQAAEVDILTGGRFRLGVGIGWNEVEYEALGMSFRDRGRRFEEQIELMRRLWEERSVTYAGRWHRVTAAGLNPLPVQRPLPIWIGATADVAIRRACRLADGFFPQRAPQSGTWPQKMEEIRSWLEEEGRDPASFGIDARVTISSGNPEDWRAAADEWRSFGASHLTLNTMGGGLEGPDAHIDLLRRGREALA
jgi:probable F420-dependent oxidoreductase